MVYVHWLSPDAMFHLACRERPERPISDPTKAEQAVLAALGVPPKES